MKAVIQRVSEASVTISGDIHNQINHGFLILIGIEKEDNIEDIEWLVKKISSLRVFNDSDDKMNIDIHQSEGSILLISQFTLHASTKKGNRPSFIRAAEPKFAIPIYELFIQKLRAERINVVSGIFGADMKVALINDGPVTIILDSKNKV